MLLLRAAALLIYCSVLLADGHASGRTRALSRALLSTRTLQPQFTLARVGSVVQLRNGDQSLPLFSQNGSSVSLERKPRSLDLPTGETVKLPIPAAGDDMITVRKGAARPTTINLRKMALEWLKEDANRRGAAAYESSSLQAFAYFRLQMSDTIVFGNAVWAVLSWQDTGGSGQPIKAQHLVRIRVRPTPEVEILRKLNIPLTDWQYSLPTLRLFRFKQRLLLVANPPGLYKSSERIPTEPTRLVALTLDGSDGQTVASLPAARVPLGIVAGRCLLLGEAEGTQRQGLFAYDLATKRLRTLLGDYRYYLPSDLVIPASGSRFLITTQPANNAADGLESATYLVHLPAAQERENLRGLLEVCDLPCASTGRQAPGFA